MDEETKARIRAAAKEGRIEYGGRQAELEYLRGAIPRERDAETRAAMRQRLEYVQSRTDEQMMEELGAPHQKPSNN